MEQKEKFNWFGAIVLGLFFLCMFLAFSQMIYIRAYGIPQTVIVSYHKEIRGRAGGSPTSCSCGYYEVNGKRYEAFITKNLPIGTEFEIKYNPIIPKNYDYAKLKE